MKMVNNNGLLICRPKVIKNKQTVDTPKVVIKKTRRPSRLKVTSPKTVPPIKARFYKLPDKKALATPKLFNKTGKKMLTPKKAKAWVA